MNERKVSFVAFDLSKNWARDLPNNNWCLTLIAEELVCPYRAGLHNREGHYCVDGMAAITTAIETP